GRFCRAVVDWNLAYGREDGNYYSEIVEPFMTFGVKEENISWLNYYLDSKKTMTKKIASSDSIFFTGGLPEQAIIRIKELGLESTIYYSDKLIIGASAGALMQLPNYFISPDDDYEHFGYYEGLNLINLNFNIEVHYEGLDVQNHAIKQCIRDKKTTVYAIRDNGAMIIDEGNINLIGEVITFNLN
ncbi:Type 1 glutamine amidotransferase-like domain-containing protein, partial [Haloplasma contractile]